MRWTRAARLTGEPDADGEVVWFWRSEAGAKVAGQVARTTVATKQRSPRRARISRKTIAWGMPDVSGASAVNTRVHTPTTKRTRGCGCIGHPAFPAPSPFPEGGSLNSSGPRRAARARTRILRCLTSERSALAQEHIVRGIGHALEAADRLAGALEISALGVNSLHGGDIAKDAA